MRQKCQWPLHHKWSTWQLHRVLQKYVFKFANCHIFFLHEHWWIYEWCSTHKWFQISIWYFQTDEDHAVNDQRCYWDVKRKQDKENICLPSHVSFLTNLYVANNRPKCLGNLWPALKIWFCQGHYWIVFGLGEGQLWWFDGCESGCFVLWSADHPQTAHGKSSLKFVLHFLKICGTQLVMQSKQFLNFFHSNIAA